jgi:hypothetical protein
MTDIKAAPTSLKRGMPPEQNNGLFGAEERLMALGVKGRFVAVVEGEIADIITSAADGTERPVVEFIHIEPLWAAEEIAAATEARQTANHSRTGANQLNFDNITPSDDDEHTDDAAFEAAAPKGKKGAAS